MSCIRASWLLSRRRAGVVYQGLDLGHDQRVGKSLQGDVPEVFGELVPTVFQAEVVRSGHLGRATCHAPDDLPEFLEVAVAVGGDQQPGSRPRDASKFGDRPGTIGNMVQHVTGRQTVEVIVRERQVLGVGCQKPEAIVLPQAGSGLGDHTSGEVGEGWLPTEDLCLVRFRPEPTGAATDFEDTRTLRIVEAIGQPGAPTR